MSSLNVRTTKFDGERIAEGWFGLLNLCMGIIIKK